MDGFKKQQAFTSSKIPFKKIFSILEEENKENLVGFSTQREHGYVCWLIRYLTT